VARADGLADRLGGTADHVGGPGDGEAKIDDLLLTGGEHRGAQALDDIVGPPVQRGHGVKQHRSGLEGLGDCCVGHGRRPLQNSAARAGFCQVLGPLQ
jgi:hypothetical protein